LGFISDESSFIKNSLDQHSKGAIARSTIWTSRDVCKTHIIISSEHFNQSNPACNNNNNRAKSKKASVEASKSNLVKHVTRPSQDSHCYQMYRPVSWEGVDDEVFSAVCKSKFNHVTISSYFKGSWLGNSRSRYQWCVII
jgi:hypothetical protein